MGCHPGQGFAISTVPKQHIANKKLMPGQFISLADSSINEYYSLGKIVWTGTFGDIRFCTHIKSGSKRAAKVYLKDNLTSEISRGQFEKELSVMKQLDHPNIVKAFEFFEDRRKFYIILEHCAGGELFSDTSKTKVYSENDAALIMRQIFSALSYLHELKLAHRNIKPENMLFDSKSETSCLKIIDFSDATSFGDLPMRDSVGTLAYASPEVLKGVYTEKCDIWAAGVVLYTLVTGLQPFKKEDSKDSQAAIKKIKYDSSIFTKRNLTRELQDLFKHIFVPEIERFSASQALDHTWIKKNCFLEIDLNVLANTFNNLAAFESNNMLRNAVKNFIVTQVLTMEQTKKLKKLFDEIDENGSGTITKEELLGAYKKMMSPENAVKKVEKIFEAGDVDGNGTIGYSEFIQVAMDKDEFFTKENIKAAFDVFDLDGNGSISSEELKTVLSKNETLDEYFWEQMVHQLDSDGDGEINLEEFQRLFED